MSESEELDLEREKTESFELGHISQLQDLGKELRGRAGKVWADAETREESEKAKQLKSLAREFERRAGEKRERWDEKYEEASDDQ